MRKALSIAGFDPSGGAGLQADLKVFQTFGVYGLSVVSALTAQNSGGVEAVSTVKQEFVKRQLSVLLSDMKPDALKTGMLYSPANVELVAEAIKEYSLLNIVVDPVILSSSGKRLAQRGVTDMLRKKLFPLITMLTPNIHEASVLAGIEIKGMADMEKAAKMLKGCGIQNVVITGGHLEGTATDILYDGDFHYFKGEKRAGEYHGTGCRFSAALTALLAMGCSPAEAMKKAKEFMERSFGHTFDTGKGMQLFV